MLLLLILIFLLAENNGRALPLPAQTLGTAANNGPQGRTMVDIILGCISTTFICTWTSVHPNVPPQATEEYGWKSLLRRLRLMFWALVAPELVLAWSAKQWYVAGKIAETYNKNRKDLRIPGIRQKIWSYVRGKTDEEDEVQGWTRTHGHLVAMGGIVLIEPDQKADSTEVAKQPPTILTFHLLEDLLKNPEFRISISKQEIEDKAKGDFLSKAIVIFHTTWFMTQCAMRFAQKLAVTELEVVTLALASLNAIMSFFWWSKPLGLTVPVKVFLDCKIERRIETEEGGLNEVLSVLAERYALNVFQIFWKHQGKPSFIRWFFCLPGYALIIFFLLVLWPIIHFLGSVYAVMASNSIPPGAKHVPAFYSPRFNSEIEVFRAIFPIFGVVFGGLHCLGWTFVYPTEIEQRFWQLGSITITSIPGLYFLAAYLGGLSGKKELGPMKAIPWVVGVLVAIFALPISGLYLPARIILLCDAVILLRKQPTTVFLQVDWTKSIPHLNF